MSTYAVLLDTPSLPFICIIELHDCDVLEAQLLYIHINITLFSFIF